MLPVFYTEAQCASQSSFSPSSIKPRYVMEDWQRRFGAHIEVLGFEGVGRSAFKKVHDPAMVDTILDCERNNGFDNTSQDVARSLPYTTGSLLSAAEHAVLHQTQACSPTSGFHHAGYSRPAGFCTFNGLMVTAVMLKDAGLVNRVGIIDCDVHWGDGTADIIRRLRCDWVVHHSMGEHFSGRRDVLALAGGETTFTRWLDRAINAVADCDLVIYQAGADPHIDDPLGGVLSTEEMRQRDLRVFGALRHKPLVWNLAGGYQTVPGAEGAAALEPVLALHRNTMQAWLQTNGLI